MSTIPMVGERENRGAVLGRVRIPGRERDPARGLRFSGTPVSIEIAQRVDRRRECRSVSPRGYLWDRNIVTS